LSEYKRSLFDKLGPEAADLYRLGSWIIIPVLSGASIGAGLAARAGVAGAGIVLAVLVGAILGAAGTALFVLSVSRGAGAAFGSFIQPSGNRTPYERQFSYEDSLVMRRTTTFTHRTVSSTSTGRGPAMRRRACASSGD